MDDLDSYIFTHFAKPKPKLRSRMQDLAARNNAKPTIVTIKSIDGTIKQYVGRVR